MPPGAEIVTRAGQYLVPQVSSREHLRQGCWHVRRPPQREVLQAPAPLTPFLTFQRSAYSCSAIKDTVGASSLGYERMDYQRLGREESMGTREGLMSV